jgi:hypothetical protein
MDIAWGPWKLNQNLDDWKLHFRCLRYHGVGHVWKKFPRKDQRCIWKNRSQILQDQTKSLNKMINEEIKEGYVDSLWIL